MNPGRFVSAVVSHVFRGVKRVLICIVSLGVHPQKRGKPTGSWAAAAVPRERMCPATPFLGMQRIEVRRIKAVWREKINRASQNGMDPAKSCQRED